MLNHKCSIKTKHTGCHESNYQTSGNINIDLQMDVACLNISVIPKQGLEVSVNISDDRKCTKVPVPPTKGSGMRKKRICYQYWNTFGSCQSGDSCPYNYVCINAFGKQACHQIFV